MIIIDEQVLIAFKKLPGRLFAFKPRKIKRPTTIEYITPKEADSFEVATPKTTVPTTNTGIISATNDCRVTFNTFSQEYSKFSLG